MNFWLSFEENQPLWKVQWNICGPFRLQDQIIHCSVQAMIHVYWQLLWHFPLFENENEEKLVQIISDDFQVYSFSESISNLTICTITGLAIRDGNLSMNRQDKKIVSAREQEATSFPLPWEKPICNQNFNLFLKTTQQAVFDYFSILLLTLSKPKWRI